MRTAAAHRLSAGHLCHLARFTISSIAAQSANGHDPSICWCSLNNRIFPARVLVMDRTLVCIVYRMFAVWWRWRVKHISTLCTCATYFVSCMPPHSVSAHLTFWRAALQKMRNNMAAQITLKRSHRARRRSLLVAHQDGTSISIASAVRLDGNGISIGMAIADDGHGRQRDNQQHRVENGICASARCNASRRAASPFCATSRA